MVTMLDGQALFDEQRLGVEVGSPARDSVERSVAGLDGLLSIDLGLRGRRIRQKGVLRAASRAKMNGRIAAISAYIDGGVHTFVTSSGEEFGDLRMDSFEAGPFQFTGGGVEVAYEIVYMQLSVNS